MNVNTAKLKNDLAFIWRFSKDDFKNKFAGSVLGTVWAFVQPLMTVAVSYTHLSGIPWDIPIQMYSM